MENRKIEKLRQLMNAYAQEDMLVAFSGGTDSSLLLHLACEAAKKKGHKVYAVTMKTKLHPVEESEKARQIAEEIGAEHMVISVDELVEAGIENNPVDRCYRCKKCLFQKLKDKGMELDVSLIMEGTNADDLQVYRPGLKAIRELEIKSPLAEAGLTKEEVRELSAEYGLSTANTPAAPCLATRFPYGTPLSYDELAQVEQGEQILKQLGLYNVRLRIHNQIARIEVDTSEFGKILEHRQEIIIQLKELGYTYITLDLEGFRSGSMDVGLEADVETV